MSWDDAGNNRAFLANTISSTHNGASIYLLARSKPDTYMTETDKPMKDDYLPCAAAEGSGRPVQLSRAVLEPGPELRQEPEGRQGLPALVPLQRDLRAWFTSQQGFSVGATKMWEDNKMWKVDPVMAPFRTAAESGHFAGYAGPAGRAAAETISKFIIVDMYAKAVQGMPAEEAVKWAHAELVKIYV